MRLLHRWDYGIWSVPKRVPFEFEMKINFSDFFLVSPINPPKSEHVLRNFTTLRLLLTLAYQFQKRFFVVQIMTKELKFQNLNPWKITELCSQIFQIFKRVPKGPVYGGKNTGSRQYYHVKRCYLVRLFHS